MYWELFCLIWLKQSRSMLCTKLSTELTAYRYLIRGVGSWLLRCGSAGPNLTLKRYSLSVFEWFSLFGVLTFSFWQIIHAVKRRCPETPIVFYINGNGGLLERMKGTGADVIGLDWTVDMADGRRRLGSDVSVQGNVDPAFLFSPLPALTEEIHRWVVYFVLISNSRNWKRMFVFV